MTITAANLLEARRADYHRVCAGVEAELAPVLGVEPATVHGWMYGRESVFKRAEAITAALIAGGRRSSAERLTAPMVAVLRNYGRPRLTNGLEIQEHTALIDLDAAGKAYDLNPSPATAKQVIRAVDVLTTLDGEYRQAVALHWNFAQ